MRVPPVTVAVCAVTIAVWAFEPLASWAIYDRAAIESGELWRLVTGSLVHYSWSHLVVDLLVFAIAGGWIEQRRDRLFAALCGGAAVAVGLAVYWLHPQMARYAGLSGVAMAAVVYVCLRRALSPGPGESGAQRQACALALGVVAVKLVVETIGGDSVLGSLVLGGPATDGFVLAPASHWAGVASALVAVSLLALAREKLPAR